MSSFRLARSNNDNDGDGDDLLAQENCLSKLADILTQRPAGSRRCNDGPVEIVDHVYLGSMIDALDVRLLRRLHITHVLNCAPSAVRRYADSLRIPSVNHLDDDDGDDDDDECFSVELRTSTDRRSNRDVVSRHPVGPPSTSAAGGSGLLRPTSAAIVEHGSGSSGGRVIRRYTRSVSDYGRRAAGQQQLSTSVISAFTADAKRSRSTTSSSSVVEHRPGTSIPPRPRRQSSSSALTTGNGNPYDARESSGVSAYMEIDAADVPGYPILTLHYADARRFLDSARRSGGRALVHCELGINRSATLVVAYLVDTERVPLTQAVRRVRIDRPNVLRNDGFRRQLVRFAAERTLLDGRRVTQSAAASGQ